MNVLQSPYVQELERYPAFSGENQDWGCFVAAWPANVVWHCLFRLAAKLLWQGFYTFDDFTMSVTPERRWRISVRCLIRRITTSFSAADYGCGSHYRQRHSGFSNGVYMARYTSGKMKAFFYIAVMCRCGRATLLKPMPGRYCWRKWCGAVVFTTSGAGTTADSVPTLPAVGGNTLSTSGLGRFLGFSISGCRS